LFDFEDISVESLLQSFKSVRSIDLKHFKTENIEDTDGGLLLAVGLGLILDTILAFTFSTMKLKAAPYTALIKAASHAVPDSSIASNLCTVSSAVMIDLDAEKSH
jgi:hypothetical protein